MLVGWLRRVVWRAEQRGFFFRPVCWQGAVELLRIPSAVPRPADRELTEGERPAACLHWFIGFGRLPQPFHQLHSLVMTFSDALTETRTLAARG
jgi:hypothetical protein